MKEKLDAAMSIEELRQLLFASYQANKKQQAELDRRLRVSMGINVPFMNPEFATAEKQVEEIASEILARRLYQNDRRIPLLAEDDFAESIEIIIEHVDRVVREEANGAGINEKERADLKKMFQKMFAGFLEFLPALDDPYEELWRWIGVVLDVAWEWGIPPQQVPASLGANDEVLRRMFSKEELRAQYYKRLAKHIDINWVRKTYIDPAIEAMAETEEERQELIEELEKNQMPMLMQNLKVKRTVCLSFMEEQLQRIYAA